MTFDMLRCEAMPLKKKKKTVLSAKVFATMSRMYFPERKLFVIIKMF